MISKVTRSRDVAPLINVDEVTSGDPVSVILNPPARLASKTGVADSVTTFLGFNAPAGIVKFNTAAQELPLLVTTTDVPGAPVVTVPTVTEAAVADRNLGKIAVNWVCDPPPPVGVQVAVGV
jgi:hypothetical protein